MAVSRTTSPPRQGIILLIVVIMLTLFLVVGLSFVLYAESEATASRIYREVPTDKADLPPEQLLSWALGQLIYPVPDDESGFYSVVRGHELSRTMYGWHPALVAANPLVADPTRTSNPWWNPLPTDPDQTPYSYFANTTPFNGLGPLRFPPTSPSGGPTLPVPPMFNGTGLSDYALVNYTYYASDPPTLLFRRDPERIGFQQNISASAKPFSGGFNIPYTYPDRTNMALAVVQASGGGGPRLLKPSFFQPINAPGLGTMTNMLLTSTGANASAFWTDTSHPEYKYLTLRPRPADNPGFPMPADPGGDVKNLPGVPLTYVIQQPQGRPPLRRDAQNDSFWMDLGFPVQTTRNGKKFKPLFAFTVLDLDGKINLNVHGNSMLVTRNPAPPNQVGNQADPRTIEHGSDQGLDRHEVNIGKVLTAIWTDPTTNPPTPIMNPVIPAQAVPEWVKLMTGFNGTPGRYGLATTPMPQPASKASIFPYNQPWAAGQSVYIDQFNKLYQAQPGHPPSMTPGNAGYPSYLAAQHRSLTHPFDWDTGTGRATARVATTRFNFPFALTDPTGTGQPCFESFPAFGGTAQPGSFDKCDCTFDAAGNATNDPLSWHALLHQTLIRSGADTVFGEDNLFNLLAGDPSKSYLYSLIPNNVAATKVRHLVTTRSYDLDAPGAPPWVTDPLAAGYKMNVQNPAEAYPNQLVPAPPMPTPAANQIVAQSVNGDYKPGDGRANLLSRLDLARKLTPYRYFNAANPADPLNGKVTMATAAAAVADRQQFSQDVFDRLVKATGAVPVALLASLPQDPANLPQSQAYYAATRYLAQLAVNIVDYVDDDDNITPFNWNPLAVAMAKVASPDANYPDTGWVYGTEVPKVVINEAYCELQNDPRDRNSPNVKLSGAAHPFQFSFWLELYNATPAATPPIDPATGMPPVERLDPDKTDNRGQPHDRLAEQLERKSAPDVPAPITYPVYQVVVLDDNISFANSLDAASNTDGWLNTALQTQAVKIQVTGFTSSGTPANPAPNDPSARYFNGNFVEPSSGDYNTQTNPSAPTLPRNQGFYILAPDAQRDFVLDNNSVNDMTPTLRKNNAGLAPQAPQGPATSNNDPVWGQAFGGTAQNAMTYSATQEGAGTLPPPTAFAARKGNYGGGRRHTVLLRRLACPALDPNPLIPGTSTPYFPTKPFNPYITVDYMRQVPTNDAVQYLGIGQGSAGGTKDNPNYMHGNERRSLARRQPYAATLTRLTEASGQARPVHATFYKHNETTAATTSTANIDVPFDWLIHLDRAPTTVTELLNVSSVAPHRLTQRFVTGQYDSNDLIVRQLQAEAKYQHLAPWRDQNARLFRALEFFTVGDRSPYPGTGGRVAGKMNINMMFDRDPVDAAADLREKFKPGLQTPSNFSFENPPTATVPNVPNTGAVTDAWQMNGLSTLNSISARKTGVLGGTGPANDRPFWPYAAPIEASFTGAPGNTGDRQYPVSPYNYPYPPAPTGAASIGVADTLLGGTFTPQHNPQVQVSVDYNPSPSAQINYTCVQAPDTANLQDQQQKFPPYVLNEMLTKLAGHLTTRSNNFAVFMTVGFFEVTDDTTKPVKLGPEIVQANGKTIRHQMFSVVDRTNLAIDGGKALDPVAPVANGRLQQAATPPVFMSLADAIPQGAGAPTQSAPKATPVVINIAGGLPTSYDALTPVVFKPFQQIAVATTNNAAPHFWRSGDRMFIGTPPAGTPAPGSLPPTYWPSGVYQWMFLDTGAHQEPVQVTLDQTGTKLQLLFPNGAQFSHPPGATLCTYQPGNPGPQGAIDYTSPQYKAVVPYTYIVQ